LSAAAAAIREPGLQPVVALRRQNSSDAFDIPIERRTYLPVPEATPLAFSLTTAFPLWIPVAAWTAGITFEPPGYNPPSKPRYVFGGRSMSGIGVVSLPGGGSEMRVTCSPWQLDASVAANATVMRFRCLKIFASLQRLMSAQYRLLYSLSAKRKRRIQQDTPGETGCSALRRFF
jgi:hypothetical protein